MLSNLMFVPSIVHTDKTRRPRLVVGDQWSIDLLAIWRGLLYSLSWTFYGWNLFIHLKTSDRTVACCLLDSNAIWREIRSPFRQIENGDGIYVKLRLKRLMDCFTNRKELKKECFSETCYHSGFKYFSHVRESEIDILWRRSLPRKHLLSGRFGLNLSTFCFCFNATLLCTKLVT